MRVKFLTIKKNTFFTAFIFFIIFVAALLRTYSPERDYVYSKHGALLFIFLVLPMVIIMLIRNKGYVKKGALYVFYCIMILWMLFSFSTLLNFSQLPLESTLGLFNNITFQLFVFLFALSWVSVDRHFDIQTASIRFAWFFGIFALVAALAAVQLLLTNQTLFGPLTISVMKPSWPQLYGWFASPNYLVDSISMGVITSFFLYASHQTNRAFSLTLVLLMLLFLVGTGSRGGILGCMAALLWQFWLVFFIQHGLRKKILHFFRYLLALFLAMTCGISALFIYVSAAGWDIQWFLMNVLRLRATNLSTGTGRVYIWQDALDVYASGDLSQILFGYGNNYYVEFHGISLHNTYLQVLVDHGLLTLLAFIFFTILFFWVAIKLAKRFKNYPEKLHSIAFLSAPGAYVVVRAMFQGPVFLSGNISWIFMLISSVVMASVLFYRSQSEAKKG